MPVAVLSPRLVRDTYLLGIDLGSAWQGATGDQAIARLLFAQVARAEALMNIHFHRFHVLTVPDTGMVLGQDYDFLGLPIPYIPLATEATHYQLTLHFHDVQAITRVRLLTGMDTQVPPQPVWLTLDLTALTFSSYDERLYIPVELAPAPPGGLSWAVDYLCGLGALPPEVVEWCALRTAMQILSIAGSGQDVTHGTSGEMLIQDGIEESVRYGNTGQYGGIYAGPIKILQG